MKTFLLLTGTLLLSACSDWTKKFSDYQATSSNSGNSFNSEQLKDKKSLSRKKTPGMREISGTLANGTLFEALQDPDGFIVSFDPYIPNNDKQFMSATSQVIHKIYSDSIKNDARISVQADIGYTIVEGKNTRYKIVPFKESNGTISTFSIMALN